jgi:hypothetical protein
VRLRERWGDLMQRLNVDKVWRPLFAFRMVLLTEHRAIDIKENFDMTRMLLCSMALMVASRSKRHAMRRQLLRVGRKGRKDTHNAVNSSDGRRTRTARQPIPGGRRRA